MSEFKFACPVCGQHISCDATKAGSQMDCPTCFQKLTVPQAPEGDSSKFILTASKVQSRPSSHAAASNEPLVRKKEFPLAAVGLVVVLAALTALGFVFRDRILKFVPGHNPASANSKQVQTSQPASLTSPDANWTLDLANVTIPEKTATGKIDGHEFVCQMSTLHGGTLDLRQGPQWPPDLGMTVYLTAARAEDLAGKTINIPADTLNPPRVKLRWKDEKGEPQTQNIRARYACRMEFGTVKSDHLSGKIYICMADNNRSWVAGTFDAEIRKPNQ